MFFDKTIDFAGIEQMLLCIHYIDSIIPNIEIFMLFLPLEDVTGKGTAVTIIDKLMVIRIDFSKLHGQKYNRAATMSGKFNSVQAHI